jgi:serine/threonine protein kinase, bacterial
MRAKIVVVDHARRRGGVPGRSRIIGDVDSYKLFLEAFFDGRNPQYSDVTVRVNGSSGQVVSIDNDPNARSAMNPRTWTFIDGRWQFDNWR